LLFSSFVFIFGFLPVALAGFFVAARAGRRVAAAWLIAASLVFYGWWNPYSVILLLTSIAVNFTTAMLILRAEARPRLQSGLLIAGVAFNILALFYFKYLVSVVGFVSGFVPAVHPIDAIVLPLGISFFSFTQIGYLVDCKTGVVRDRSLLNYTLFVTFFPHLIAGPILHNGDIMPQFADRAAYRLSGQNLAVGASIFIMGLAKKVLCADPLSGFVAAGYADTGGIACLPAWHLALCYSLQLYFDFSGYSDMAIGLARMVNIKFPRNFESPYKAQSVIEYWQRWHITLTKFLTSYLYTPIAMTVMRRRMRRRRGVNRAAQRTPAGFAAMIAMPLLVTMGLAGVWHGSGLTFLVFGLMHGVYLCINHASRIRNPAPAAPRWYRAAFNCLATYLCVLAASVMFRAPSLPDAMNVLTGMAGLHGLRAPAGAAFGALHLACMAVLYGIVWFMPNTQQIMRRYDPVLGEVEPPVWPWPARRLVWGTNLPSALSVGALAAAAVLLLGGTTEFLYFQF
jgi:D-alanyl-lipoteichoic acid acyltransferase DltB (MBOAT superfamily)